MNNKTPISINSVTCCIFKACLSHRDYLLKRRGELCLDRTGFMKLQILQNKTRQFWSPQRSCMLKTSVSDPDPDWSRIQSGHWISALPISSHTTFPLTLFKTSMNTVFGSKSNIVRNNLVPKYVILAQHCIVGTSRRQPCHKKLLCAQ